MRFVSPSIWATAALLALGIATATATPRRLDAGVHGLVLYGPTCPVQRVGQRCERPYRATIIFRREPSHQIIARAHSGADGRFTVRLRAGRYDVKPTNGRPFPRASAQTISVRAHHFTHLRIQFDSGIR